VGFITVHRSWGFSNVDSRTPHSPRPFYKMVPYLTEPMHSSCVLQITSGLLVMTNAMQTPRKQLLY